MNRLLDPPAIKVVVQRMACTACGAEANAACTCGVAYKPKAVQAAEAIAATPEKSNRAIAEETGLSEPTVRRARASCDAPEPETVTGRDGKIYPATKPEAPAHPQRDRATPITAQAAYHLAKIVELLRRMNQQERLVFRRGALAQMADANLDRNEIEF
jgi:hypothetical protein